MKRIVNICRSADRHAKIHERGFAETRSVVVEDGDLIDVINRALKEVIFNSGGRFVIEVEEPHE